MKKCRAPQTRGHWKGVYSHYDNTHLLNWIRTCEKSLKDKYMAVYGHHDWAIAHACAIREARKRGIYKERS